MPTLAMHHQIVVNAANEGIPVASIARILATPFEAVHEVLKDALAHGSIIEIPRSDWTPGTRVAERLPVTAQTTDADLAFLCKKAFRITSLECGFLMAMLKARQIEKARLHNIIEQHRMARQAQPNALEATDPKMVDVIVCKLRKKLKTVDKGFTIETIWGGGYYIEAEVKQKIMAHANGEPDAPKENSTGSTSQPEFLELAGANKTIH